MHFELAAREQYFHLILNIESPISN